MKKIFRMAVVCALAGATLLYTGCTKDYSDDINDLKERVSTVESTVAQLQAAINAGSVITSVTPITTGNGGYTVTLSNGKTYDITNGAKGDKGDKGDTGAKGDNGSVVTIDKATGNWFIDGKDTGVKAEATVDTITLDKDGYICINGKSTGVKAGTVAVWDATSGTVTFKGINADGSDLVIGVCELQSMVTVPQLYFDGVEALSYDYIGGFNYTADTLKADKNIGNDDSGAEAILMKSGKHSWAATKTKAGAAVEFSVGEIGEAEYHVNPASFDLTSANFSLAGYDKKEMTRADELKWSPVFKSIEKSKDAKLAVVKYQIENPAYATTANGPLSVVRLNGEVKNGNKNVSSDYAAIVPFREQLKALAFTAASNYVTNYKSIFPCSSATNVELYETSEDAVKNIYSVDVQYQTPKDLAEIIDVHVYPLGSKIHEADMTKDQVMTLAALKAKYPEFDINFELVPYKVGANTTEEQMYGQIEGTTFYPCWVESDAKTQHRNDKVENTGNSSVGRQPVVLATLTYKGKVALYGYFKIKITKTVAPATFRKDFVIKAFDAIPYVCDGKVSTTWAEASHIVLEKELNMTYTDFLNRYGKYCETDSTYIKKADGTFAAPVDKNGKPLYGEFVYTPDATGTTINDKYEITFTKAQLDSVLAAYPTRTISLYKKFGASANDYVYIGLTVTIEKPAVVKFIQHNPKYWFAANGEADTDVVFVNPLVPNTTSDDVTVYSNILDNYWVNNRVKVDLDETASAAYKNVWKNMTVKYHYELNKTQTCKVDGKALVVKKAAANETEDKLYYVEAKDANILATLNVETVRTNSTSTNVGTPDVSKMGKIQYSWAAGETVAKTVLNQYTHPVLTTNAPLNEKLAELLYADVQLVATYGTCDIPCGTEDFHVGFFRPVDIIKHTPKALKDAVPTGDNVIVGELFRAKDWQNYDIFTYDSKKGVYADGMYGTAVDWYKYYQFKNLIVNIEEIKSDQTGTKEYLHDYKKGTKDFKEGVNNAAKVWVAEKATPEKALSNANTTIDISAGASKLGDYVFHYENNTGVVQNFNLYVPIAIEYSWGVVKAEIEIPVTATVAGN